MPDCRHLLGVYYCLEVDQDMTLDLGKVAFFPRPALAITMCALCNQVFDSASTLHIPEEKNGTTPTIDGSTGKKHRARAQG